jgi:hypothetical protein
MPAIRSLQEFGDCRLAGTVGKGIMMADNYTSKHEARNAIVVLILIGFLEALADLITGVPLP